MNQLVTKSIIILIIVSALSNSLVAQQKNDSLRIIKEALQLIKLPEPIFDKPFKITPSSKDIEDLGFEQINKAENIKFMMSDGIQIAAQKYVFESNKTVILVHGVLSSSYTFNKMAGLLRKSLQAKVIAIDLRGHGMSGGKPGDISTPNQYTKDLDAIINNIKNQRPTQKIILAGHSIGGGIVLKHVETFPKTKVQAYVLFAPNLGATSPTTSQKLDVTNNFIKTHLSRGLGLKMLNEFGIYNYDSLNVVFYNLPKQMPIHKYSYRSMKASYPTNFKEALKMIDVPLLTFVGSNDEAFIAEEYPIVMSAYSTGECFVIENETHNGIRHNKEAMKKIEVWAIKNKIQ